MSFRKPCLIPFSLRSYPLPIILLCPLKKKKRLIASYIPFHKLISPFTPTGGSWVAGRPKKTRRV